MQRGLNIGIGSWIDAQYEKKTLPAFPSSGIPFELKHFHMLKEPEDLIKSIELSLYANRVGGFGSHYDEIISSSLLWNHHKNIIYSMVHAASTLNISEKKLLEEANRILFDQDGISPSDIYQVYEETRRNYEDLVFQNADASDIQDAYDSWIIFGHREEIEEARATKLQLTRASSNIFAQNDVSKIDMALNNLGGDIEYAPTYFSPLSALSTKHWLEAEVDFQALEKSIKPNVSQVEWKQFCANKVGRVRFKYISIDLSRPWFNEAIYEADDWHLPKNDLELVASGNGKSGKMPWFFSRIYMAKILDIHQETVQVEKPPLMKPDITFPKPSSPFPTMIGRTHPLSLFNRSVISEVLPHRKPLRRRLSATKTLLISNTALAMSESKKSVLLQPVFRKPVVMFGHIGSLAKIKKVDTITVQNKLTFTLGKLASLPSHSENSVPEEDPTTYIVGFGRKNLPHCPDPNPNYQWTR